MVDDETRRPTREVVVKVGQLVSNDDKGEENDKEDVKHMI